MELEKLREGVYLATEYFYERVDSYKMIFKKNFDLLIYIKSCLSQLGINSQDKNIFVPDWFNELNYKKCVSESWFTVPSHNRLFGFNIKTDSIGNIITTCGKVFIVYEELNLLPNGKCYELELERDV